MALKSYEAFFDHFLPGRKNELFDKKIISPNLLLYYYKIIIKVVIKFQISRPHTTKIRVKITLK